MNGQNPEPPSQPNSRVEQFAEGARNAYLLSFAPWHVWAFSEYCNLWKSHPRVMKVIHLSLMGIVVVLLGLAILFPGQLKPARTKPESSSTQIFTPTTTSPFSTDSNSPTSGKPLELQVSFRKSLVGKGMVIQLVGNAGSSPRPVQVQIDEINQTVRLQVSVKPSEKTEIGWKELKAMNFIVRSGQQVTFTSPGYTAFVVTIP